MAYTPTLQSLKRLRSTLHKQGKSTVNLDARIAGLRGRDPKVVKRKWTRRAGLPMPQMYMEPTVPIAHIERGSGGDIRYGIRAPGLTTEAAIAEAQQAFTRMAEFVKGLNSGS